jgi:hypothetical protein
MSLGNIANPVEEDATMAGVVCAVAVAVNAGRAEGASGDEASNSGVVDEVGEESQQHGCLPIALAVPAAEFTVGDEASPVLAGEG